MEIPRYSEIPDQDWDGNIGDIALTDIDIDRNLGEHLDIRHDLKDYSAATTSAQRLLTTSISDHRFNLDSGSVPLLDIDSRLSFTPELKNPNATLPQSSNSYLRSEADIAYHLSSFEEAPTTNSHIYGKPYRVKDPKRRRNPPRNIPSLSKGLHNSMPSVALFPVLAYSKINTVSSELRTAVSTPGSLTLSSSLTSSSPLDGITRFSTNLGLNSKFRPTITPTDSSKYTNGLPRQSISSMDSIENELFNRLMLRTLNVDSTLLIHTTFALSAYYLRSNCLKNFSHFDGSSEQLAKFKNLRTTLIRLSSKYYGLAIHKLRVLISSQEFDVSTAIIVSSLLNKISIYEHSNLNHSITFSKGMVSIFNDVLSNLQLPENNNTHNTESLQDLAWITNYVIHASKTNNFPPYDPTLLTEYLEVLEEFKSIQTQHRHCAANILPYGQRIIFHFNHLHHYTTELINLLKQRDTKDINEDPSTLYKILRHWLIILPPKVHIMIHLKQCADEITLMNLYKSLSRILENLFPSVFFYFLQGFCGGVSLWTDARKDIARLRQYYSTISAIFERRPDLYSGNQIEGLLNINKYCIRLTLFFQKRSNTLSACFGDQRQKPEYSPEVIRANLNEVMISRFNKTNIRLRNYIHLPQVTKIQKTAKTLKNIESYRDKLFYYNQNHFNYFASQDSTRLASDVIQKTKMDPMLRLHIFNTINVIDENPVGSSSSPAYKTKTPMINYSFVFEDAFCKKVVDAIELDYQQLFDSSGDGPLEETVVFEQHETGGLFVNDIDPTFLASNNEINAVFSRRAHDLVSNQDIYKIILKFYDLRNKLVSPANKTMTGIYGDNNDNDDELQNFYDDLNVRYFEL